VSNWVYLHLTNAKSKGQALQRDVPPRNFASGVCRAWAPCKWVTIWLNFGTAYPSITGYPRGQILGVWIRRHPGITVYETKLLWHYTVTESHSNNVIHTGVMSSILSTVRRLKSSLVDFIEPVANFITENGGQKHNHFITYLFNVAQAQGDKQSTHISFHFICFIILIIMLTLFIQVSRASFCPPLGDSSLHLWTSLSLTLSCLIIFSGLTFWTTGRFLIFAVRERCLEETMPCWIYWHQKTSARGSCTPYKELINTMLLTLSLRMEVRDKQSLLNLSVKCRETNSQITSHFISLVI